MRAMSASDARREVGSPRGAHCSFRGDKIARGGFAGDAPEVLLDLLLGGRLPDGGADHLLFIVVEVHFERLTRSAVGCEPGKGTPANEACVFFVHPEDFLSGELPHLFFRGSETGNGRTCATLRFGSAPGTRDERRCSPQGQAEGDAQASKLSGSREGPREGPRGGRESTPVPDTSDAVWRQNTKDEVGRARLTLLRWGETGKRKRREPASARAMRRELRVSIPFNPMSATPITILSRA